MKNPFVEVLSLSVTDRLTLVEFIWESIVDHPEAVELTDEQRRELDTRLESYHRDRAGGSTWDTVKTRITGPH